MLALVDQGLSSISNVLAVVLVAHALDREAFGRFALAYAVLVAVLGLSRSWFGTRISLITDRTQVRGAVAAVLGSLTIVALPIVAGVAGMSWLLAGGKLGALGVVVAVAAPVVCMQDALRFASVAGGRPGVAATSDAVWVVALLALLPVASGWSGELVMGLWLGAALVALLVATVGLRVLPDLPAGLRALRTRHATSESVSFGTLVSQGASLVVTGVVAAVIGPAAVGSLRGASTIMGPLNVVFAFVNLALTPMLVRRPRRADLRFCLLTGAGVLLTVTAWGSLILLIPASWGRALLDETWAGARAVLPFTVLEYMGIGIATASTLGLKVRHEAGMLMRQKAVVAVVTALLGVVAAVVLADVRAVAAALAVAGGVSVLLGWRHLAESTRSRHAQPAESGTP